MKFSNKYAHMLVKKNVVPEAKGALDGHVSQSFFDFELDVEDDVAHSKGTRDHPRFCE